MKAKRLIALLTAIVAAGNASATTISAAETTTAASTQTHYGDVNLDGKINVADAVAVLQYIVNRAKYALDDQSKLNADVIGPNDGITGTDAIVIQMVDAGLVKPDQLPITQEQYIEITKPKKQDPTEPVTQPTTTPPAETPVKPAKPTAEQLEKMKENPLLVTDSNGNLFIYGDINKTMRLNSSDITNMNKLITNKAEYNPVADLNGDGVVDEYDVEWLQDFIDEKTASFPVYEKYDTDGDGLSDYAEVEELKTDRLSADTDGDGISDLEELYMTGTDPLKKYSENESVADCDLDPDDDGLTNIEEVKNASDPNNKDTDGDGFEDGYEVKTLKTSPIKDDTDEDGLTDWEEVRDMAEFKLDPNNKATNGTPDNQRTFKQIIAADDPVLSEINTEDNAYNLSLELTASGCAKNHIIVRNSRYTDYMKNGAAVGAVPEIIYDDDFVLDSITLKFEIKEELRDNVFEYFYDTFNEEYRTGFEGIRRFNLFKFFEEIDEEMPINTEFDIDNNTVYLTMESDTFEQSDAVDGINVGSYSLVDLEVWGAMMNEIIEDNASSGSASASKTVTDADGFMRQEEDVQIGADSSTVESKTIEAWSPEKADMIIKSYKSSAEEYLPESDDADSVHLCSNFGHVYAFLNSPNYYSTTGISDDFIQFCKAKGGHVMTIDSESEYDFIMEQYYDYMTDQNSEVDPGLFIMGCFGKWRPDPAISPYGYLIGGMTINGNFNSMMYKDKIYIGFSFGSRNIEMQKYFDSSIVQFGAYTDIEGSALNHTPLYVCEWDSLSDYMFGTATADSSKTVINSLRGKRYLDGPLSPDNNIDTNKDGVSDYECLNFKLLKKLFGENTDRNDAALLEIADWLSMSASEKLFNVSKITHLLNQTFNISSKNPTKNNENTATITAAFTQWEDDPILTDSDRDYLTGNYDLHKKSFDPTPVDANVIDDSDLYNGHTISDKGAPLPAISNGVINANQLGKGKAFIKKLPDGASQVAISYERNATYNRTDSIQYTINSDIANDFGIEITFPVASDAKKAFNNPNFIKLYEREKPINNLIENETELSDNILKYHFIVSGGKTCKLVINPVNNNDFYMSSCDMNITIYQDNWVYAPTGGIRGITTDKPLDYTYTPFEYFLCKDASLSLISAAMESIGEKKDETVKDILSYLSDDYSKKARPALIKSKLDSKDVTKFLNKELNIVSIDLDGIIDGYDEYSMFLGMISGGKDNSETFKSLLGVMGEGVGNVIDRLSKLDWAASFTIERFKNYYKVKSQLVTNAMVKEELNICIYNKINMMAPVKNVNNIRGIIGSPVYTLNTDSWADAWHNRPGTSGAYLSRYIDDSLYGRVHVNVKPVYVPEYQPKEQSSQ